MDIGTHLAQHYHERKSTTEVRVTKLITHIDTRQTEILMLKEDNCRNQRI